MFKNGHLLSLIIAGGLNLDLNYKNVNNYLGLSPYGRVALEYITPFNLNLGAFVDLGYNFAIKGKESNGFDVRAGISVGYAFDIGQKLYEKKDNRYDNLYIGEVEEKVIRTEDLNENKDKDTTDKDELLDKVLSRLEEVEKERDEAERLLKESKENIRYVAVKESTTTDKKESGTLIKENRDKSNITIDGDYNFNGAIARFTYSRSNIYDVFLTPLNITDIRLEQGEEVVSVILGDPNNWNVETLQTSENIDGEDYTIYSNGDVYKNGVKEAFKGIGVSVKTGDDSPLIDLKKDNGLIKLDDGTFIDPKTGKKYRDLGNGQFAEISDENELYKAILESNPSSSLDMSALSDIASPDTYIKQNGQSKKLEFLKSKQNGTKVISKDKKDNMITKGTIINAILINGINTDLPGEVNALLRENVYDYFTNKNILLPKGSKIIGEYDSNVSWGQNRVQIVWTEVIRPDGTIIALNGYNGTDTSGMAGMGAE